MGTTVRNIVVDARTKVAATATSRTAVQNFLPHTTSQPFVQSPMAGRDGFECVARQPELTQGFGINGDKEGKFILVLRLGHAPFSTDDERENLVQRDVARLADLLEASWTWAPTGTMGVWFRGASTDKRTDPNWWITEMLFEIFYTGAIELV